MGYGVSCSYDTNGDSLHLSAPGSFQVDLAPLAPSEQVMDFSAPAVQGQSCIDYRPSRGLYTAFTNPAALRSSQVTSTASRVNGANQPSDARAKQYAGFVTISRTGLGVSLPTPVSNLSTTVSMINDSMQLNLLGTDMQFGGADALRSEVPLYHFTAAHYEILDRFRSRTALTIGVKSMAPLYRDCVCKLAGTVSPPHAFTTKSVPDSW